MTLTKEGIRLSFENQLGISRFESSRLVHSLEEIIKATLANGEDVLISRFGKFIVRKKGARQGRNPHTGKNLTLAPRRVITFKCAGVLRNRLNGMD
jgi:integration host factor subunit alpha